MTSHRLLLFVLAGFIVMASSTALASPLQAADPDFAVIDKFVESEMQSQRIPGLALGIVQGDQIVYL